MNTGKTPCGIPIPQELRDRQNGVAAIREFVQRAEALDFDSLWLQESILGKSNVLEPVTLLTYAAALTERLRLGVSIMVLTQRNPVQLAKSLASLDNLSHGRLDVGIGIGGRQTEETFGYTQDGRVQRFEESIQVMKTLWTQPEATSSGRFWNFENISVTPLPVQQPHPPIWFGARQPPALRRAVTFGDAFMGAGSSILSDFTTQNSQLQQYLDEADRDPATFRISKRVYLAIDNDKVRAEQRPVEWFGNYYGNAEMGRRVAVWGSRDEVIEKCLEFVTAGAQHLLLHPVFDEMEHMEQLAAEVMLHL